MISQFFAIFKLLSTPTPERLVSLRWLLQRPNLIDEKFSRRAQINCESDADFQKININGEIYIWPQNAPLEALVTLISELQNQKHPSQYLWGDTQISKGDVVIDIGACEGSFSARITKLGAYAIAVEPSNIMSKVINRLFEVRGLDKPVIVNCLLGAETGEFYFVDNEINPGASRIVKQYEDRSYPVPMMSLDQMVRTLNLQKVDFIKCDAEGADVTILKSGRETLKRFRPKLAICTYHNDRDYVELYEYLNQFGYNLQGKGFLNSHGKYRVFMLHAW